MAKRATKLKPSELCRQTDNMLRRIGELMGSLDSVRLEAQAHLDLVVANYRGRIAEIEQQLDVLDKSVKDHAKKHRVELFGTGAGGRIEHPHGALICAVDRRVKKIRNMLQRLENLGAVEAIKIAKSVDWNVIEKMSDERLVELGTKRKIRDVFSYVIYVAPKE